VPPAESAALRAGFAHWLRTQGLSDHEVASVLGIARVRTVDRLLARHAALDAQRCLRKVLNR
jgi:predicted transcriptional regulator